MAENCDISKMLTLSTAHITENTAQLLNKNFFTDLTSFPKGDYGWFIYVPDYCEELSLPKELLECMKYAKGFECDWLCLDRDGIIEIELEAFTW